MQEHWLADEYTYSIFITAAHNAKDFESAKIAYCLARDRGKADVTVYNAFIKAAGQEGKFREEVLPAFEEIRSIADEVTYGSVIEAAGRIGEFEFAQEVFGEACSKGIANDFVCGNFIIAAGNTGHFKSSKKAYDLARAQATFDIIVYNAFIKIADQAGKFREEVLPAFEEIRSKADNITYSSVIEAAGRAGEFEIAQDIFKEACSKEKDDAFVYSNFIIAAGNTEHFKAVRDTYYLARKRKVANAVVYGAFIKIAGQSKEFKEAQLAFNEVCSEKKTDPAVYSCFIDAASIAEKFEIALEAFRDACANRKANAATYGSIIKAAGRVGKFATAQELFKEACAKGMFNIYTCNCFIIAADNTGNFKEAHDLLQIVRDDKVADDVIQSIFFKVLVQNGHVEEAIPLFKEIHPDFNENITYVDLHGFNFAEARIACELLFKDKERTKNITLVIGRGSHSDVPGESVVRDVVISYCTTAGIRFKKGIGRIYCLCEQTSLKNVSEPGSQKEKDVGERLTEGEESREIDVRDEKSGDERLSLSGRDVTETTYSEVNKIRHRKRAKKREDISVPEGLGKPPGEESEKEEEEGILTVKQSEEKGGRKIEEEPLPLLRAGVSFFPSAPQSSPDETTSLDWWTCGLYSKVSSLFFSPVPSAQTKRPHEIISKTSDGAKQPSEHRLLSQLELC